MSPSARTLVAPSARLPALSVRSLVAAIHSVVSAAALAMVSAVAVSAVVSAAALVTVSAVAVSAVVSVAALVTASAVAVVSAMSARAVSVEVLARASAPSTSAALITANLYSFYTALLKSGAVLY